MQAQLRNPPHLRLSRTKLPRLGEHIPRLENPIIVLRDKLNLTHEELSKMLHPSNGVRSIDEED